MPEKTKKKKIDHATDVLAGLSVVLVFILPLKFGMMAGLPETATTMPTSWMELLYFSWPYFIFTLFSATLLAGVVVREFFSRKGFKTNAGLSLALSWILLLLASLVGFLNASTLDFPLIQLNLFLGVACLALAIHQILALKPAAGMWYVNAVLASTILISLLGLNQYFSGFEETLNYVYAKEMASGAKVSANMLSRLRETRVFATFSICNSLAAHLILTIPICVWAILSKSSSLKTAISTFGIFLLYMSPSIGLSGVGFFLLAFTALTIMTLTLTKFPEGRKRIISFVVIVPALGMMLFVFRHTNSRGAFVAASAAIFAAVALAPLKTKTKLIGGAAALLLVIPFLFTDILARSLKSMYFRFDYYLAAVRMFFAHPFAGVGWGDFFHEYMRMKRVPGSESPHTPHNFILSFASQTGIAGLLASVWIIVAPFLFAWRHRANRLFDWRRTAILAGWLAWCLHSLADFNIQVPGSLGIAVVLILLLDRTSEIHETEDKPSENKIDHASSTENESDATATRSPARAVCLAASAILAVSAFAMSMNRWRVESNLNRLMTICGVGVLGSMRPTSPSNAEVDAALNVCVEAAPYSPFPWICAGNLAQSERDWGRSEYFFKEALKRSPERSSVYYHLFLSEAVLGKHDEALKHLEKAAELFPNAYARILRDYKKRMSIQTHPTNKQRDGGS
ncbi:MAG: hypothetical protein GXP32_04720 [Kiritimatiellaeota bacterium]|nr:hypothetical protein [Kiritimatiellota bacterium]